MNTTQKKMLKHLINETVDRYERNLKRQAEEFKSFSIPMSLHATITSKDELLIICHCHLKVIHRMNVVTSPDWYIRTTMCDLARALTNENCIDLAVSINKTVLENETKSLFYLPDMYTLKITLGK